MLKDLPVSGCRIPFSEWRIAAGWNVSAAYQVLGTLASRRRRRRCYERSRMLSVKPVRNSTEVRGVFACA